MLHCWQCDPQSAKSSEAVVNIGLILKINSSSVLLAVC